jgi:hypothetical protein
MSDDIAYMVRAQLAYRRKKQAKDQRLYREKKRAEKAAAHDQEGPQRCKLVADAAANCSAEAHLGLALLADSAERAGTTRQLAIASAQQQQTLQEASAAAAAVATEKLQTERARAAQRMRKMRAKRKAPEENEHKENQASAAVASKKQTCSQSTKKRRVAFGRNGSDALLQKARNDQEELDIITGMFSGERVRLALEKRGIQISGPKDVEAILHGVANAKDAMVNLNPQRSTGASIDRSTVGAALMGRFPGTKGVASALQPEESNSV